MSLQYQVLEEFTENTSTDPVESTNSGGEETTTEDTTTEETTTEETTEEETTEEETTEDTTTNNNIEISEEQILPIAVRVFNESHVVHLLWFIIIYLLVYVFFGEYLKRSGDTSAGSTMSRAFDYVVFFWAIGFTIFLYYTSSEEVKSNVIEALMEWTIDFYDDPLSILSVSLFMVSFYAIVILMRVPMGSGLKPYIVELIESKGWVLIASLMICYFFKYVLGINLMDFFRDERISRFWKSTLDDTPIDESEEATASTETQTATATSESSEETTPPVEEPKKEEVFNISNNNLSYREAQAVCKSYDARLATYDEVEGAYNNGGEWCNYGWSEGQMAFFPTQKKSWEEQQKDPTMKNRCGRPGVNGGHIPNPNMKFGANCFGVKPEASALELQQMSTNYESNAPKTAEERMLEEKSQYWKENRDKLALNSFNQKKWSYY